MNDQTPGLIRFGSRDDRRLVESGTDFAPKFDAQGLIPAIATDAASGEVLMMAWMNEEALRRTLACGEAVYYSRSRRELWHKGATSGHVQRVVEVLVDCDQDAIVLRVEQAGAGACHTGYRSCFFRRARLGPPADDGSIPAVLETVCEAPAFNPDSVYGPKP